VLGLQPLRVFRCLRSEPASPFRIKQEETPNSFSVSILFGQILGGDKICPSILNWYQETENFVANYSEFGRILNIKERYSNYTIKSWK